MQAIEIRPPKWPAPDTDAEIIFQHTMNQATVIGVTFSDLSTLAETIVNYLNDEPAGEGP